MSIDHCLATYGSLRPGECNHHQLAGLAGTWHRGTVRGTLVEQGWGADLGYPALIIDPKGPEVPVMLFVSADLPAHWARLDAFEGDGYERVRVTVQTPDAPREAWLYACSGTFTA